MSDWKLVHENSDHYGTTKIYQDSDGNVRIDSFNGDVRDPEKHDRFSLNTSKGGSISGHGYGHNDKFDSSKSNSKTK